ncbi:DUF3710 domain-containing protein [Streptomyces mirabilis]|uniref:DUF3710 domain-containing protein n=1 Tax=Streptomyces mirabilis TaxID=68239 RepID=UPI0036912A2C
MPIIDLGGLGIPAAEVLELHLVRSEKRLCGVTVVQGSTALQLQAFHALPDRNWDVIRGELSAKITRGGGSAKDCAGPAGVEIRASVPTIRPGGSMTVMQVRFLGQDGPGWPRTTAGRVRGRPRRRGTRRAAMTLSKAGASPAWPGVRTKTKGRHRPSAARWTFVVRPPRDRPRA